MAIRYLESSDVAFVMDALELTKQWLDNLELILGTTKLIDAMPNNFAGRYDLQKCIDKLEGKDE